MARPRIELDENKIAELRGIGCTVEEIANFFGCSHDTITRNYAYALRDGENHAKRNIRKRIWNLFISTTHTKAFDWVTQYILQQPVQNFNYQEFKMSISQLSHEELKKMFNEKMDQLKQIEDAKVIETTKEESNDG